MAQPVSAAKNSCPAAALTAATVAKVAAFGQKPTKTPIPSSNTASSNATKPKTAKKGHGSDRYGAGADNIVLKMPVGTLIRDLDTDEIVADLTHHGQRVCLAKGGKGGLGNIHFKSSVNRAPKQSTPGEEGETRSLQLELKVLADVAY